MRGEVLLDPVSWTLLGGVGALALRRAFPRVAPWLGALGLGALGICALPPVANRLQRGLEEPRLESFDPHVPYDVAIVLTGVMDGAVTADSGQPSYNESVDRLLRAFDLLRAGQVKTVLFSGSSWRPRPPDPPSEASLLRDQLVAWGIDPSRVLVEELSRDTHENAIEATRMVREHGLGRVLLVTSAAHMQRAQGCFAAQGLAVDTLPVDYDAYDPAKRGSPIFPSTSALDESSGALREYAGRLVYRLKGWSR